MSEASRVPMPEPDPSSFSSGSPSPEETDEEDGLSPISSVHQDVVRRLRTKVDRAATLLEQLQAENERLRRRVEELEQQPSVPDDKAVLTLDDDPETLRDQISDFIEAIDTYLEDGSVAPVEADFSPEDTPS